MRLAYTFVFSLALINGAYTTTSTVDQADPAHTKHPEEPQKAKLSWLQRLRIGTTMKDGKFVSDQNPLHPDKRDIHDPLHINSHDHHTHEEEVILRFFGHHLPHSEKNLDLHNLESCPGLHASTEENLRAMRRLLNSAYSLIEGLEWSNDPTQIEHAHQHHHLILDNEPFRTSCADMQSSTVTELKMIETLLRGARKLAGDLAHNWEGVHHFAPEIFDPEHHDGHHDGHHEHDGHHTGHYGHEEHYPDHHGHEEHYAGHHGHEEHYTGHHGYEEEHYHGLHDSHGHFEHGHAEYGHSHPEGHHGHEHGHFEHHDGHSHPEHVHPGDHHETQQTFRKDH